MHGSPQDCVLADAGDRSVEGARGAQNPEGNYKVVVLREIGQAVDRSKRPFKAQTITYAGRCQVTSLREKQQGSFAKAAYPIESIVEEAGEVASDTGQCFSRGVREQHVRVMCSNPHQRAGSTSQGSSSFCRMRRQNRELDVVTKA